MLGTTHYVWEHRLAATMDFGAMSKGIRTMGFMTCSCIRLRYFMLALYEGTHNVGFSNSLSFFFEPFATVLVAGGSWRMVSLER